MREIKFRGLDENGKWAYGQYVRNNESTEHYIVTHIYHVDGWEWNVESPGYECTVIDQFTGAYDIKGVEIYENDIVRVRGFNYVVAFLGGCWVLKWGDTGHGKLYGYDATTTMTTEVIGNIHQNPELLEDGLS